MRTLKMILSFTLTLLLVISSFGLLLNVNAAEAYPPVSALAVPRIVQPKSDNQCCWLASFVSVYAYCKGSYDGKTFSGGQDYSISEKIYKDCFKDNNNKRGWNDKFTNKYSFKRDSYSLSTIYNQLKLGKPVIIYAKGYRAGTSQVKYSSHASVIIGYTGNPNRLEESGFTLMEIGYWRHNNSAYDNDDNLGFANYANNPCDASQAASCFITLSSWKAGNGVHYIWYPNYVPNNPVIQSSHEITYNSPIKMRVNKDKAAHRYGPYEKCKVYEQLSFNQEMTIVGEIENYWGNLWYKSDKGYWIYSKRLSHEEVGGINFSTKKSSNVKKNKKSQITTVPAPIVKTAYEDTVIPGPAPKLDGYAFLGYSTTENASKPEYQIGDKIQVKNGILNLYCVWRQTKVTMKLGSNKVALDLTNNSNIKTTVKATVNGDLDKSKKKVEVYSDNTEVATVTTSNRDYNPNWILSDVLKTDINITAKAPGTANIIVTVNDNNGKAIVRQTVSVNVDERYSVNYYDGDKKVTDSQTKHFNKSLSLTEFIPEKDEHTRFLGWSTSKESSAVNYGPGDLYKVNSSIDLYAVWVLDPYIEATMNGDTLTINGRGNMPSYPTGKTPWNNYASTAKKIVINTGVTTIGSNAFANFKRVTQVDLAEGITYIGSKAFNNTSISRVVIPSSVKRIGNRAFGDCKNLVNVNFQNAYSKGRTAAQSLNEQGVEVGAFAFENCTGLTSVSLPNEVTDLGIGAFNGCANLESVELSNSLTALEDTTFFGCNSLTDINIPNGVTEIGDSAFNGCSALPEIELPSELDALGDQAFAGCSSMEAIVIPDGIEEYGSGIFANCSALSVVDLPDDMEYLPDAMFSGCSALETVEIPENVEIIGDSAFRNCSALKPVEFSDNISSINIDAFNGCESMDSLVVPASVTSIGDFAFSECGLKTVELNEGLTTIGSGAFAYCEELEGISIPASVTLIDDGAFMGCSSLVECEILESQITIGDDAFSGCSSLTEVQLPESIVSLGEDVFGGCSESFKVACFSNSSVYDQVIDTCEGVNSIYPVTGITLNKTNETINIGDTLQLNAVIAPINATDKSVVWTTNHPEIATVDENGLVTSKDGGTVIITATTNDNKLIAECEITVIVPVEGIELEFNETSAYVDDTLELSYKFLPDNPTNISVRWTSSNKNVATVEDGEVTIVGVGAATITATTEDGSHSAKCVINTEEYINVDEIVLAQNEYSLHVGETIKLNSSVLPENASDPTVSYIVNDESEMLVELDEYGNVTALSMGEATIIASVAGVEEKEISITVLPKLYVVTWNVDGVESTQEYEPGATIQKPADPVKEGFEFKGWTPEVPETMPAEDITFTAVFESVQPDVFTLTYDANGGNNPPASQTGNGSVTLSSVGPTREGYNFLGWSEDINATSAQYTAGQPFSLTQNTILHAVWEKKPAEPEKYTVTFVADGKVIKTVEYTVGDTSVAEPAIPAKEGYTGKWSSYTLGASDITVNAIYTKIDTPTPTDEYKLPTSFNEQTAAYNTIVTVNVTLKNVPSGAKVYIDGKEATVNGSTYSAEIGQASSTKNVKIEVKQGTKVLDSSTLTVKVDAGFFAKLISFFSNFLFNMFKWKKVTVNF